MILRYTQKLGETCTLTHQENEAVISTKAIRLCPHCGKYTILPPSMQAVMDGLIAYIDTEGKIRCVSESEWERVKEEL